MKIIQPSTVPAEPATSPLFTGEVSRQPILTPEMSQHFNLGIVNFPAGVRRYRAHHCGRETLARGDLAYRLLAHGLDGEGQHDDAGRTVGERGTSRACACRAWLCPPLTCCPGSINRPGVSADRPHGFERFHGQNLISLFGLWRVSRIGSLCPRPVRNPRAV
jgi:hypothetical protein